MLRLSDAQSDLIVRGDVQRLGAPFVAPIRPPSGRPRCLSGHVWGKSHQHRPIKDACKAAKIAPAISFHILRHTYASQAVMAGIPLMVVAENLGHSDTRMVERHYGHLAESYKAKLIRENMPALGGEDETNVTALKHDLAAR